ncbi:Coiled-coil domain-containing protein 84 [Hibiscus syriacus]|uniref:Coiled-coil domain-containing protein 84 n=1 Tax=Hibiscus syriacus TaxID=106335 RepID=A0A6A2ZR74_HIBSY|nr:Coiled-coil domain-containing protein 84 [Hibiscus syriacus]
MAGAHHLKNLKHFLWQYGGKMEQLDKYRISETDLTKWEKKCESLKDEAMAACIEESCGVVYGASNDIHNYISNSRFPEVANIGSSFHEANFSLHVGMHSNMSLLNSNDLTAISSSQQNLLYNSGIYSGNVCLGNVGVCQTYQSASMGNGENSSQGLRSLMQVSSISTIDAGGNVHSGAPPPWFEASDQTSLNNQVKPALNTFMLSNKSLNSRKLNPKRVGVAWAEKRKMELEKEKRGEIVESDCDANWLPNVGRVWESGSRKESRKEFESEKQKFLKVESHFEMPLVPGWVWNIDTRRNLCDWELDQWLDLMTKLKDFKLTDSVEDFLSWSASGDGLFSVKSCRKELGKVSGESDLWVKGVWQGLSPPRVEVFLWQLAHQKVAVREELVKRGLQLGDEILYSKLLGYSLSPSKGSTFFAMFLGMSLFFIARFMLSKWFLAKYPKCPIQEDVLIGDPSLADGIKALNIYNFQVSRWIPPPMDFLKMNVDGAVRVPPPVAELKAIKRGIEIYMSSCWVKVGRLIVESDCKSAVEWVHTPALAPVFILPLVKEISSFISDRVHSIRLIPRVCNGEADSLAKMGIG